MVSGTPAYMSPEQARGEETDHRTDIYSLGIVLYEMLAGRVPFEADSTLSVIYKQINEPPPLIPGIPSAVQKVIDRALTKNPDNRYPTSRHMAAEFSLAIGMAIEPEMTALAMPEGAQTVVAVLPAPPTVHKETLPKPKPAGQETTKIARSILLGIVALVLVIGSFFVFSRPSAPSGLTEVPTQEISVPTENIAPSEPLSDGLPDAAGMAEIPVGTYEVGSSPEDSYHSAPMSVQLKEFWIDKYQTTYAQYQLFLSATGAQSPGLFGAGNQPVRGITWDQAVAYCSWANKRLPTEAEWEVAGRGLGTNPQLYPWGNDPTADGKIDSLPDQDTYEVGTLPFNKSPYGVYDMVGNIWEWVGVPYLATSPEYKILRGGRFGLPILELSYRLSVTKDDPRYVKYAGFRCASDRAK
jgi:formylglycine-generating enzyme required for sulfatase activity